MAVIDIVVISVLALFGIIGMIKGFLNTLLSLFGNLASVGVAVLCAKPVAKFLDSVFGIVNKIGAKIAGTLTNVTPFVSNIDSVQDGILTGTELKTYMPSDTLYHRALKLFVEDSAEFNLAEYENVADAADKAVTSYVGVQVAKIAAIVIAAILMFVLLRVAVKLLAKLFDALAKNKAVSGLDRSMGLCFGLLKGAILVCLTLGIFYLIANETVNGWIETSVVTKWIYNYICQLIEWVVSRFNLPTVITDLFPQMGV